MKIRMKKTKKSLCFVGFLQAVSIFLYCSLIGVILWKGEVFFGPVPNFTAPLLALSLLVTSVIVCALLAFGYPVYLFWDKKESKKALELVGYTALWLILIITVLLTALAIC